jgi:hypothetical protein
MLDTLGLARAARLFATSSRNLRRWRDGTRRIPHGIGIVIGLLTAKMITVDEIETVIPVLVRANGNTRPEPPAPVEPAPEQSALACAETAALANSSLTVAEKVLALAPGVCRWPCGDLGPDFRFCGDPVVEPPYCAHHRTLAYLAPRPGRGHGVRGFVVHGRHGRPPIPGAFSATGATRAPKILLDRAGDLPSSAPPPA